MGRPPLGTIAMTSTERSRRHRLKPQARIAELEREVARLTAENAQLRAEKYLPYISDSAVERDRAGEEARAQTIAEVGADA
jgi:hypothetical protein